MPADALDWFCLRFPRAVEADGVTSSLIALNGLSTPGRRGLVVLQVAARGGAIEHHVAFSEGRSSAARAQLTQAVPGLGLEPCDAPPLPEVRREWRIWLSTRSRPLDTSDEERLAHHLLVALSGARRTEYVRLRWTLGPVRRPMAVGTKVPTSKTSSLAAILTAPVIPPGDLDGEARSALRNKQGRPGWRALGSIAVAAASIERQRQLLGRLTGALRSAQGSGVQVGVHAARSGVPIAGYRWQLALNVDELTGLIAWPIGDRVAARVAGLAVNRTPCRPLPPVASVRRDGRVLADASYPGRERPLTQTPHDATFHTHLLSPTGGGKSTLIAGLVLQDIARGLGGVVVDPKGDLVTEILARVPPDRVDDVVVLDPTDDAPVGLNPLGGSATAEVVADQMLAVFRGLYEVWGPRVQDVLSVSLITLARQQDMTLCALPLLLTNAAFRRRVVARLDDPLGLSGFWSAYEAMSEAERQQVIAPALNRVRPFLLRPQLRAVVGQAQPRFTMRQVFTERKVLLVSLARGLLGPDVANLLGGLVISQLWNTVLGRAAIRAERRRPVLVYIDEFQDVLHLNTPLPDVLAQARGLGVGFTLAHQHLGQLPTEVRAAVMANARSRVIWQLGSDDAVAMARTTPLLEADDFASLPRFEVYLSLATDGHVSPLMSGRTRPLPPPLRDPEELRALSRQRYGRPRSEVDAEVSALVGAGSAADLESIGTKRRRS